MAWSTQQLADLAHTTVKSVRYYHQRGLLEEPERSANGYHKKYEVRHLVRLLQIRRLSELGVPLDEIATLASAEEDPEGALRALDTELAASIDRLTAVREELALILRHPSSTYVPTGFAPLADRFTDRQRSLLMVYASVMSEESMGLFHQLLSAPEERDAALDAELEALPADADAETVADLVERMLPMIREARDRQPWSTRPGAGAPAGETHAEQIIAAAMVELYNPAQMLVLRTVHERLDEQQE